MTFELVCMLPTLRRPTIANFDAVDFSGNFSKENDNDSSRLCAKEKNSSKSNDNPQLHLRGIMKYIKVWNSIIYICSPMYVFVMNAWLLLCNFRLPLSAGLECPIYHLSELAGRTSHTVIFRVNFSTMLVWKVGVKFIGVKYTPKRS